MRGSLYRIPMMSGVYILKCIPNGEFYVGSTPNWSYVNILYTKSQTFL